MITPAAKAAATKRNNLAHKDYPLFSDDVLLGMGLLTTPDEEQDRLDKEHERARQYLAQLEIDRQARADSEKFVEAWARALLGPQVVEHCVRIIKACPAGYGWTVWGNALADEKKLARLDVWRALRKFCGLEAL